MSKAKGPYTHFRCGVYLDLNERPIYETHDPDFAMTMADRFNSIFEYATALAEIKRDGVIATQSNRIKELEKLLTLCKDVIDDELENRPARHSLGRLYAACKKALAQINT